MISRAAATNSSTLARGTHAWSTVVQIWPAFISLANRMRSAARRSGKSSHRMGGALPPQFKRDGPRLAARCAHPRAAGLARAGEQQVVERQLRELDADAAGLVEEA